jgi:Two component regulator propeller
MAAAGGEHLPSSYILSLLGGRDGRLWIGTDKGLASWKDGKLTQFSELTGRNVVPLLEDRDGTVWAGGLSSTSGGRLCAIHGGRAWCYGEDDSLGIGVGSLYEDTLHPVVLLQRQRVWAE